MYALYVAGAGGGGLAVLLLSYGPMESPTVILKNVTATDNSAALLSEGLAVRGGGACLSAACVPVPALPV